MAVQAAGTQPGAEVLAAVLILSSLVAARPDRTASSASGSGAARRPGLSGPNSDPVDVGHASSFTGADREAWDRSAHGPSSARLGKGGAEDVDVAREASVGRDAHVDVRVKRNEPV